MWSVCHDAVNSQIKQQVHFDRVIDRLLEWPESAETILDTPAGRVFRHAKVPHSHYRLVYYLTDEALKIVAIAHERRMPLYWSGRD